MPWKPGQSGNPGGNPRVDSRTRRMLEGLGVAAVKRLGELIASDNQPVALGACREVLARVAPVPKANILAVGTNASAEHMAALLSLAGRVVDRAPTLIQQPQIGGEGDNVPDAVLIDTKPLES